MTKRRYDDGCAAAHALEIVGERWALLVVREMLLGPKRFTDLRAGLPGISPNVLSQRLDELERAGVVERVRLGPPVGGWVYELTPWGQELEPIILQLGRWGARSPHRDPHCPLSTDSLILSLRTMFDRSAAAGFAGTFELRFGEDRFHAHVRNGRLDIGRGTAHRPDAVISGDPQRLAEVVYEGSDLDESGVEIDGDRTAVERFVTLFRLPVPVQTGIPK